MKKTALIIATALTLSACGTHEQKTGQGMGLLTLGAIAALATGAVK